MRALVSDVDVVTATPTSLKNCPGYPAGPTSGEFSVLPRGLVIGSERQPEQLGNARKSDTIRGSDGAFSMS
jgi:hypothetical protein